MYHLGQHTHNAPFPSLFCHKPPRENLSFKAGSLMLCCCLPLCDLWDYKPPGPVHGFLGKNTVVGCHFLLGIFPTHRSILAFQNPWTEEPGGWRQSKGSQRGRYFLLTDSLSTSISRWGQLWKINFSLGPVYDRKERKWKHWSCFNWVVHFWSPFLKVMKYLNFCWSVNILFECFKLLKGIRHLFRWWKIIFHLVVMPL